MDHHIVGGTVSTTRDLQMLIHSITMAIILARVMESTMGRRITAMAMARGLQHLMQIQRDSTTTDIIRAMGEVVMGCPIVATTGMARGLQSLIQNLKPSITTAIAMAIISRAMG